MPPKKKQSKRMSLAYKPNNLISSLNKSMQKERENRYERFNHESNVQLFKQRLDKIKSLMEDSDFQLQAKTRTKKLELAFKNTDADDLPDETDSDGDYFMSEINNLLKLEEGLKKELNNPSIHRNSTLKHNETSEALSLSSKSFKVESFKNAESPPLKKGPEIHIEEGDLSPKDTGR
jgi:hypothetical protein